MPSHEPEPITWTRSECWACKPGLDALQILATPAGVLFFVYPPRGTPMLVLRMWAVDAQRAEYELSPVLVELNDVSEVVKRAEPGRHVIGHDTALQRIRDFAIVYRPANGAPDSYAALEVGDERAAEIWSAHLRLRAAEGGGLEVV